MKRFNHGEDLIGCRFRNIATSADYRILLSNIVRVEQHLANAVEGVRVQPLVRVKMATLRGLCEDTRGMLLLHDAKIFALWAQAGSAPDSLPLRRISSRA